MDKKLLFMLVVILIAVAGMLAWERMQAAHQEESFTTTTVSY